MKKVAIVNANSFGRYFPEFIDILKENVGEVTRFKFPSDISAEELSKLQGYSYLIVGTTLNFQRSSLKRPCQ